MVCTIAENGRACSHVLMPISSDNEKNYLVFRDKLNFLEITKIVQYVELAKLIMITNDLLLISY